MWNVASCVGCFVSAVTLGSLANAAVINVDVQPFTGGVNYTGTAAAPGSGTFWNSLNHISGVTASVSNLKQSDGLTTTAIGMSISAPVTNPVTMGGGTNGSYSSDNLMRDFVFNRGTNATTITFSGLQANQLVDLYLYGFKDSGTLATFTFGGIPKALTKIDPNVALPLIYTSTGEGRVWVKFLGLQANGSGMLTGSANAAANAWYSFNGAQLVIVPEPNSTVLLGLSSLALLRRRRA